MAQGQPLEERGGGALNKWLSRLREWRYGSVAEPPAAVLPNEPPRIGIAFGGGFARGVAHAGVLRVLQANGIPLHCITGVSAGAIVAAAYASGATPDEIATAGASM